MNISLLISVAAGLVGGCERGENPEYERALLEFITDLTGLNEEDRDTIAKLIWAEVQK